MSKLVINEKEIILDQLNIAFMNTRKDSDKTFMLIIQVTDETRIGTELIKALKESGNIMKLYNKDNSLIMENKGVVNIGYELSYEKEVDAFEERIIIESIDSFI